MKYLLTFAFNIMYLWLVGQDYTLLNEFDFYDMIKQQKNKDTEIFIEYSSQYLGSDTTFRPTLLFEVDGNLYLNSIFKEYTYRIDKNDWSISKSNNFLSSYAKFKYLEINENILFWDRKEIYAYNNYDNIINDRILDILKTRERLGNINFSYDDTPSMILDNNLIFFCSSSSFDINDILVISLETNEGGLECKSFTKDEALKFLISKYPNIDFNNGYQLSNEYAVYEPEYLFHKYYEDSWNKYVSNTFTKSVLLKIVDNIIYIQRYNCIFKIDIDKNTSSVIQLAPILNLYNSDLEYPENDYYLCAVDEHNIYVMYLSPALNKIYLYEVSTE